MKKWMLGILLLLPVCMNSHASLILSSVTGGDMVDISVTVEFSDGSTEVDLWTAFDSVSGSAGTLNWSLSQSGNTFGEFSGTPLMAFGEWTLVNLSDFEIVNVSIDAGVAGFFFDNIVGGGGNPNTIGSAAGRPFVAWTYGQNNSFLPVQGVSASYFDQEISMIGDLWGGLNISWDQDGLAADESIYFVTDTDMISDGNDIPEPGMIILLLSSLFLLRSNLTRSRK